MYSPVCEYITLEPKEEKYIGNYYCKRCGSSEWEFISTSQGKIDFSDDLEGKETIQEIHSNKITCARCGSYSESNEYVTSSMYMEEIADWKEM